MRFKGGRKSSFVPGPKGTIISYTTHCANGVRRTEPHAWFLDDGAAEPKLVPYSMLVEEDFLEDDIAKELERKTRKISTRQGWL